MNPNFPLNKVYLCNHTLNTNLPQICKTAGNNFMLRPRFQVESTNCWVIARFVGEWKKLMAWLLDKDYKTYLVVNFVISKMSNVISALWIVQQNTTSVVVVIIDHKVSGSYALISQERFDLESLNFTWTSIPTYSTATLETTSLATASRKLEWKNCWKCSQIVLGWISPEGFKRGSQNFYSLNGTISRKSSLDDVISNFWSAAVFEWHSILPGPTNWWASCCTIY